MISSRYHSSKRVYFWVRSSQEESSFPVGAFLPAGLVAQDLTLNPIAHPLLHRWISSMHRRIQAVIWKALAKLSEGKVASFPPILPFSWKRLVEKRRFEGDRGYFVS